MEYHITHYDLEQGALEIQYIEEFFGEFPRKKTAAEIVRRLEGRAHLILLASAPLPDDPGTVVPVSFKVAHEIRVPETEPKLIDLVNRLRDDVQFDGRRVLYTLDWRHAARLARPGAFPRAHRAAGALGDRAGLRRDRREDQEQVLRHARHARSPALRGREVRAATRATTPNPRCT